MYLVSTAASETKFSIESIKALMDGLDPAALLPDISTFLGKLELICRVSVLLGPLILLVMGITYISIAPKEANHYFGYRTFFGMGSVSAWRYTQRLAGMVLGVTGLVLTIVMLFISLGFASLDAMSLVWKAVRCLAWEAGVSLAVTIFINAMVFIHFNAKGQLRKR